MIRDLRVSRLSLRRKEEEKNEREEMLGAS
jgi:hypothetical protein